MSELLPCPFCGNEPLINEIEAHSHGMMLGNFKMPDHPGSFTVECPTDGCCGMIADTKAEVVSAWNRRPAQAPSAPAAPEMAEMEARKDAAYLERNQVVAALAKCFPSGATRTAIEGWSEDWHGCVYIDLPTGQASWHFHDSQAYLFDGLPPYVESWDGHDTPEKYRRLAALSVKAEPAAIPDGWKLVPENPTGDMFRAANKVDDAAAAGGSMHGADDEQIWHAMYFAAPTPPTTGEA